jgi:predicted nucleotidyltransferase
MLVAQQTSELTLDAILDALAQHRGELKTLGVRTLGVFGSFCRGEAHAESDIDFLVTMERPTLRTYMAAKQLLENLFGRSVDLIMAETIKPRIRERIFAEVKYAEGLSPVSR